MPTYPNETWPADAAVEALDGATDAPTGLPYIAKGTSPTSVPSLEVQYNRREHRSNLILAAAREGMVVDEGSFKIGVYPVNYTLAGVRKTFGGATGVSIAADATKVAYLDATGALVVADAWPEDITTFLPLATLDTHNARTTIADARNFTAFCVPSAGDPGASDRRIVTAYCASVGANQSDAQIFAYDPPEDLTLLEVQVFCTATTGTASVNLKEAGTSVLSAAATPSAGAIVKPAVSDANISGANNFTVHVTTNGAGSITNLSVTMLFKAPLAA